ncbi:MAG: hypothetical protein KME11_14370 [Timaviella obliquedivisa GSE-PSE-MK23-08B]|nr:hypothetical protein [Timaviella obliquedivisa GSE-PSE-MK23-08B]
MSQQIGDRIRHPLSWGGDRGVTALGYCVVVRLLVKSVLVRLELSLTLMIS